MKPLHIAQHPCAPAEDHPFGGDPGSSGKFAQAKEKVTRTARETKEQIKHAASETAAGAKEKAERTVDDTREHAAERIHGYSSALHESARSFEEQDPNIAWFAHRAADRVQEAADYLRNCDLAQLRRDAENTARRHPAVFFGGMFAVGIVIGNVLKASRRDNPDLPRTFDPAQQPRDWSTAGTDPLQTATVPATTDLPTHSPQMGF